MENDRNFDLPSSPFIPIRPASLRDLRLFDWGRDPRGHETIRMAAFFLRNSTKLHISHAMTLGKIKKRFPATIS